MKQRIVGMMFVGLILMAGMIPALHLNVNQAAIIQHVGDLMAFPAIGLLAVLLVGVVEAPLRRDERIKSHSIPRLTMPELDETLVDPRGADSAGRIRALVIGAGDIGRTLADNLEASGRYKVVGFIDDTTDLDDDRSDNIIGTRDTAASVIENHRIEEIFLAYAPTWQQRLAEHVLKNRPDTRISIVPTAFESMMRLHAVESYGDIAVVECVAQSRLANHIAKRAIDIVLSLLGLVLLSPLMLISALMIKLTSRGPVIFSQERTGRYGKPFQLFKFRTMTVDAEAKTGPIRSSGKGDARLTRVGGWLRLVRIDEIPQLWNVLRGEMSIVGPRPERPCFTNQFDLEIPAYARRHDVRPGITGLAQICGGYHTDARDKLRFDLIYIAHMSVWLDIKLMLRTVQVVLVPERHKFELSNATNK